ncbi:glycosyltransferase [Curtobacterium sp. Leaf261]|uniref:glycosyltransferase n=1 Tax=Curtobacterium sp. Leaf261 TaxID=1736311 RepID=UPI0006F318F2|nr:glycosyltransferase [Curtobacterium sp. Leaf261]KQO62400.1 hypothetical protein ASF23_11545 [Curtobacterium sp. Leaf261]
MSTANSATGGVLELRRPMTSPSAPEWTGALWVGDVDLLAIDHAASDGVTDVRLRDAAGYRRARLLVRRGDTVLGFVEVPVADGVASLGDLVAETARFDRAAADSAERSAPDTRGVSITVVICTRDRADMLRAALTSVLASDHPGFDVVVVDNAPATTASADLVAAEFDDRRVRLVTESVPGLSSARNTGLRHATGDLIAYTDDDVVVDPGWLTALARAFASAPDVQLVSGLVPSGELRTPVQRYFDDRVSWSKNLASRTFRLDEQPADLPMFPFSVGEFGTGANFALRRRTALELGGFDTAFGAGTPTGGGEDLDIFTRVLFAGGALVVEPSAIVWHRHRADLAALRAQGKGYGVGLGAWLTKVALDPRMASRALRRAPQALVRLVGKGAGELAEGPGVPAGGAGSAGPDGGAVLRETAPSADAPTQPALPTHAELAREVRRVGRLELFSVLVGPVRFLRMRWNGAGILDHASRSAISDPGAPDTASLVGVRRPTGHGIVAVLVAIIGVTAIFPSLPEWWRGIALALLVFIGPGMALRTWLPMRPSTTVVAVPATGAALMVLVTAAMAGLGAWGASGAVLLVAVLTAVTGLDRRVFGGRPAVRTTAFRAPVPRFERAIAVWSARRRPSSASADTAEGMASTRSDLSPTGSTPADPSVVVARDRTVPKPATSPREQPERVLPRTRAGWASSVQRKGAPSPAGSTDAGTAAVAVGGTAPTGSTLPRDKSRPKPASDAVSASRGERAERPAIRSTSPRKPGTKRTSSVPAPVDTTTADASAESSTTAKGAATTTTSNTTKRAPRKVAS